MQIISQHVMLRLKDTSKTQRTNIFKDVIRSKHKGPCWGMMGVEGDRNLRWAPTYFSKAVRLARPPDGSV